MSTYEHYIFGMKRVSADTLAEPRADLSEMKIFYYDAVQGRRASPRAIRLRR